MSYIGNPLITAAFVTDQFSGTGSQTVYTMSVSPANGAAAIVAVSGVLQDPSTYSVNGTTLTFSAAPPSGTGNISVRYLGIPASGVTTTAYRTVTEFTATAGQTVFTPPSYVAGFLDVYRNGVKLAAADFTATNGTTVTLTSAATAGDIVTTVSFQVSSVINAIPATAGAVNNTYLATGAVLAANMGSNGTWAPTGTVIQVVQNTNSTQYATSSAAWSDSNLTGTITPKLSTSKILVLICTSGSIYNGSGSSAGGNYRITRNGSAIAWNSSTTQIEYVQANGASVVEINNMINLNYLDSPATTSACTYTLQIYASSGNTYVSSNNAQSTIILMEIAG